MGLIEKSMLERWEESKLEAELDKAPTKPQECCCESNRERENERGEKMTIEEAIKDLEEEGINLGAGDYVDLEALKVAVDVMKDYQRIAYENERLRHENQLAFKERDELHKLIIEHEMLKVPTMNITITKEQTNKLGFKFEWGD